MSATIPQQQSGRGNPSKVGMMGSCFFTSRSELLDWVNSTLHTNLTKVEQCSSGAVYCQLVDAAHGGGLVRMHKVNWTARAEPECIANYKLLQSAFDQCRVDRNVDVDKLIRGKYQDNLEFLQWVKHYYDSTYQNQPYDANIRRDGKQLPAWALGNNGIGGGGGDQCQSQMNATNSTSTARNREHSRDNNNQRHNNSTQRQNNNSNINNNNQSQQNNNMTGSNYNSTNNYSTRSGPGPPGAMGQQQPTLRQKMSSELNELKTTVDGLETERDYYFGKLREIEILCQNLDPKESGSTEALGQYSTLELVTEIQRILYKEE